MATNAFVFTVLQLSAVANGQFVSEHRKDYLNLADAFSQLKHDYHNHFEANHTRIN